MGLFSQAKMDEINAIAEKSKEVLKPIKVSKSVTSSQHEIQESTKAVLEYFKDSPAILITSKEQLHEYVVKAIESGYCGIDTETTGLDRIHDTVVGASLYYPGGVECYIPCKHLAPVFEVPYENQLSYEDVGEELEEFVKAKTKMIFANADFDLAMIYKDFKVDLIPVCYYDVISAWRCIKEDEEDNRLKALYMKYVKKGQGDPKSFSDFFNPKLFPYCKPEIAKLYAANDAKITYELFRWQLPYVTKDHPKCTKRHMEKIANLWWNVELPMIRVCALMHRTGIYFDKTDRDLLKEKYSIKYQEELDKLFAMVQEVMDESDAITVSKSPFKNGASFNEASPPQVKYLLNNFLHLNVDSGKKDVLKELNIPITNQILEVRAINKLLNTFIDKLPREVAKDGRIHATFSSMGASTGRMSSSNPNLQQIPSHALDIRHEFRATPSKDIISECKVVDNKLQITLFSYDSVTLNGGVSKDVIDLSLGDEIISIKGILKIHEINHHLPNTTISFDSSQTDDSIRHTTPPYVMMSSDYSQQEPKLTAYVSQDPNMIGAFKEGKDIYSTIASLAFKKPYEECCEFYLDENGKKTDQVNRDGKERRSQAKGIVLGVTYGLSIPSLGENLFGANKQMTDEEKTKAAQSVYDAVLEAFPNLKAFMNKAQADARKYGYVETILGRRRHIPDMQLKPFEFKAGKGYVNPDIDPLDPTTLQNKNEIPERIVKQLEKEFANYKYYGMVVKATKRLDEEHIRVINNSRKITDASRKCVNCVDDKTEILTTSGWKKYNEVSIGDEILSFDIEKNKVTRDHIQDIIISEGDHEVVKFNSSTFNAVSTMNHRWVVCTSKESPKIVETEKIYKHKWPDYPILRCGDNEFEPNLEFTDNQLKFIGWALTDGQIDTKHNCIFLYQSTRKTKNATVYHDMIDTMDALGIAYTDRIYNDPLYHDIYVKKCEFTSKVCNMFPNRVLTYEFLNSLSQHQAQVLMKAMLQADGSGVDGHGELITLHGNSKSTPSMCCSNIEETDLFQYLAFIAGYATNVTTCEPMDCTSKNKLYESMGNIPNTRNTYYTVTVLKRQRAHVYPHNKSLMHCNLVWCVSTNNHTWIARREGKVFITGNSIIQGSAADLTKIALLKIFNNKEWNELGARILVPVHDELIAEVPIRNAERAGELLGSLMSEAGNFLPFTINCDVETSYKWYGLSFPCPYQRPNALVGENPFSNLTTAEIQWIQYHLFECEYTLPVYKDKDGKKPLGDAALGVNGTWSQETEDAINDYLRRYKVPLDNFVDNIFHRVNGDIVK